MFDAEPGSYRHWKLELNGAVATVRMQVDPLGGLRDDYELKLNSYDLAVDIELADLVQRLRFEHPEVRVVVLTSGLDKVFSAGANIQMLARATHAHKVNFCKYTNETRTAIEDATGHSGQVWIAAVNGTAAGGGYELALACDEILLVDDKSSAVSLPEVPLLAVLPATGGLTRLLDKRGVRRDLADAFATRPEGVRGDQALEWGLVDHLASPSRFPELVRARARARSGGRSEESPPAGIRLHRLEADCAEDRLSYGSVDVRIDRDVGAAFITLAGPSEAQPTTTDELVARGDSGWLLAVVRQFDDAILRLRFNEPEIGTWVLETEGESSSVLEAEEVLAGVEHWLAQEIRLCWARTLKRLDMSSRSLVALVEPGSCFAGCLAELALAADRSYMLEGQRDGDERGAPALRLSAANDGWFPTASGLSRLQARFWGQDCALAAARALVGKELLAADALAAGLVTFSPDDLDWDEEVRLALEERQSFSPDALTGLEANLRSPGPETMETKIFGRLSAWQNWIFQRPSAVGEAGALRRFGTGSRPSFERTRT